MTKAISMAIELDQDIMVTNMCVKSGEDWTNSFQELDRKQSYVRTGQPYMPPLCGGIKRILEKNKEIAGSEECSPNAYCL